MVIRAIWAQTSDGIIGDGEKLLWRLPEDMKHFSELTRNGTVVMGRRTWDSLPERFRPLPERNNIIISRSLETAEGASVSNDLSKILQVKASSDVWVIGGGEIYYQAMPYVTELHITRVFVTDVVGSTVVPPYEKDFSLISVSPLLVSSTGITYQFEYWVHNV